MKLHHYGHPVAVFCSLGCREAFSEDRQAGAIYGPYWLPDYGRCAQNAEEMSALTRTCPYCGTKETKARAAQLAHN
jgi:hypothetical protein